MQADTSLDAQAPAIGRHLVPAPANLAPPAAPSAPVAGAVSFENMDRSARAAMGRLTQGISPNAVSSAILDWSSHLMRAPGRQLELSVTAWSNWARLQRYALSALTGTKHSSTGLPVSSAICWSTRRKSRSMARNRPSS